MAKQSKKACEKSFAKEFGWQLALHSLCLIISAKPVNIYQNSFLDIPNDFNFNTAMEKICAI